MELKHKILQDLKGVATQLGKTPTRNEYRSGLGQYSQLQINKAFGGFSVAIQAAGLGVTKVKSEKWRYRKTKIESITIHEYNLEDLFERAGNPKTLKVVAMPDTHDKYKDEPAVDCFLAFTKFYNPDIFIILGDFMDCEGLSHWPSKTMEPRRIANEAMSARLLLDRIEEVTPNCKSRFFLEGNHEDWINQYCVQHAEMFDGLDQLGLEINIQTLLQLKQRYYSFLPINHFLKIGKAHFTHGVYQSQNHAQMHMRQLKCNIYYGHLHDDQSCTEPSIQGTLEAQSLGCLCRLDGLFLRNKPSNWVHSFGIFEFFRDGTYTVFVPKIRSGKLSFNGEVFDCSNNK